MSGPPNYDLLRLKLQLSLRMRTSTNNYIRTQQKGAKKITAKTEFKEIISQTRTKRQIPLTQTHPNTVKKVHTGQHRTTRSMDGIHATVVMVLSERKNLSVNLTNFIVLGNKVNNTLLHTYQRAGRIHKRANSTKISIKLATYHLCLKVL